MVLPPPVKRPRPGGATAPAISSQPSSRDNSVAPPVSRRPPVVSTAQPTATRGVGGAPPLSAINNTNANMMMSSGRTGPALQCGGATATKPRAPLQLQKGSLSSQQRQQPPQPSPLEVQLRARLGAVRAERVHAEAMLQTLRDIASIHGPDAIEQLVDDHARQREALRNSPDPLDTINVLAQMEDERGAILASIDAQHEDRNVLRAAIDKAHEDNILAREQLDETTCGFHALAEPLEDAKAAKEVWDEKIRLIRAELDLERDSTYGLSAEAAALLKEAERLKRSKTELEKQAAATEMERRTAHSLYEELKGTIRVYCRVRGSLGARSGAEAPGERSVCSGVDALPSIVLSTANDEGTGCWSLAESIAGVAEDVDSCPTGRLSTESCASRSSDRSTSSAAGASSRMRQNDCRRRATNTATQAGAHNTTTTPSLPSQFSYPDQSTTKRDISIQSSRLNATSTGVRTVVTSHHYDRVFAPTDSQETVFESVGPLVDCAIDGYRVCILAYGQTGSGKTYSMEGDVKSQEHMGITPRAIKRMFERKEALTRDGWSYKFTCFFVEIYNDNIRDLLETNESYHKAFFAADSSSLSGGTGTGLASSSGGYVPSLGHASSTAASRPQHDIVHKGKVDTMITNVKERVVRSPDDVYRLLDISIGNRSVAKTAMNERSSRSHCVFTIRIEGHHEELRQRSLGNLCLVDLAGSERVAESQVQGVQLKEAVNINKSLSFLGDCICALASKSVVPWRNCKLTWLLQNYLGGDGAKVLMLVTATDKEEHVAETINSLRFAAKVNQTVIGCAPRRVS